VVPAKLEVAQGSDVAFEQTSFDGLTAIETVVVFVQLLAVAVIV
jgi:hypothetical protein